MTDKIDLREITKKFVKNVWNLDDSGRFPKDTEISSQITFASNAIVVRSVGHSSMELDIYDDRIELSWAEPPFKAYAADPLYFDYLLAALSHLMLFASMGWDSTSKVGEYTKKRVWELNRDGHRPANDIPNTQVHG